MAAFDEAIEPCPTTELAGNADRGKACWSGKVPNADRLQHPQQLAGDLTSEQAPGRDTFEPNSYRLLRLLELKHLTRVRADEVLVMKWFRSLAAELFPSWHERRLLKRLKADPSKLDPLTRLQRTLASAEPVETGRPPASPRRGSLD